KKGHAPLAISLEPTADILAEVAKHKGQKIVVGFAAETDHVAENARKKLVSKNGDLIVANDVAGEGEGFHRETNALPLFSRHGREALFEQEKPVESLDNAMRPTEIAYQEPTLPKIPRRPGLQKVVSTAPSKMPPVPLPAAPGPSLFDAADKIVGDTLLRIREDLGECTRCKLYKHRHTIVFGDGSPKAELVFVGEGPGADEDAQGLPSVGRAG